MTVHVSLWGVLLAAIAAMVVGMAWYSPVLFGKQWMKAIGITDKEMKEKMAPATFVLFVAALLTAYVLAIFTAYLQSYAHNSCLAAGLETGFLAWAGFGLTTVFAHGVFEPRGRKLLYINAANRLVTLMVMGLILGLLM